MAEGQSMPVFIQTGPFSAKWDRLGLKDDDLRLLELSIADDLTVGEVVKGTNGVRKMRFARRGSGKSGGFRIFYAAFPEHQTVLLVGLLAKNEEANITAADRNSLAGLITSFQLVLNRQKGEGS